MKILLKSKGGPGSGNHNHAGIPGHQGGSAPAFGESPANITERYNSKGEDIPFVEKHVDIRAYRVGSLQDPHKRGVFFSGDREGAEEYGAFHPGEEVQSYDLSLDNVLIAGHQNSVSRLFFKKPYQQVMASLGGGSEAMKKFDRKVIAEAKKRGIQAIIYTRPAAPAKFEVMVIDKTLL